jgi:hypothetical protein
MGLIFGSARSDEHGHAVGGAAGDQTGREVSTQAFYVHSKGWHVIRPKSAEVASKIAKLMLDACNNNNIGYDQYQRTGVITHGIHTKTKTEADCSALVRACVKEATGKDPGDFYTGNEVEVLEKTGLFEPVKSYTSGMTLYNGDILVTKTKGHTGIIVSGNPRKSEKKGIDVDGSWGKETTRAAQKVFKTTKDGIISNQPFKMKSCVPACSLESWEFWESKNRYNHGSELIKAMQEWLHKKGRYYGDINGLINDEFVKGLQKFLKVTEKKKVGTAEKQVIGEKTVKAFQKWLNGKMW